MIVTMESANSNTRNEIETDIGNSSGNNDQLSSISVSMSASPQGSARCALPDLSLVDKRRSLKFARVNFTGEIEESFPEGWESKYHNWHQKSVDPATPNPLVEVSSCPSTRVETLETTGVCSSTRAETSESTNVDGKERKRVCFPEVDETMPESVNETDSWHSDLRDIETGNIDDMSIDEKEVTEATRKKKRGTIGKSLKATKKVSKKLSKKVDKVSTKAYSKLFGDEYSKKEGHVLLLAGAFMAFNSGFVNGTCISGLLFPSGVTQMVAGYASSYTESAFALLEGDFSSMLFHFGLIGSYAFGAFLSGVFSPDVAPYQIQPSYGPTFLVGGIFLMAGSIMAALGAGSSYVFYLVTTANGIQNGIASIYSANLIRCSLTGTTTDSAIIFGQYVRGNKKNLYRGLVLFMINFMFWVGGIVSFFASRHFLSYTLFFNATLFWVTGIGLIYFLTKEIGVSLRAAIYGTWEWEKAIKTMSENLCYDTENDSSSSDLVDLFDKIDLDGDEMIEPAELLAALTETSFTISAKGVKILMKAADQNGDGLIDREEWAKICAKIDKLQTDGSNRS